MNCSVGFQAKRQYSDELIPREGMVSNRPINTGFYLIPRNSMEGDIESHDSPNAWVHFRDEYFFSRPSPNSQLNWAGRCRQS